jgi:1-acyl-sn-glycerol-3-phosphate acyltransferase
MIIRFVIAQIIFIFITLPFILLPRKMHFKLFYPIFFKLYFWAAKTRIHNLSNNIFDEESPVILASNHKSFVDYCFVAKQLKNPFTVIIKKEMINNIAFRFLAWKMGLIPVDRTNYISQLKAIQKASNMITKDKYSLIIFIEGWYTFDKPIGNIKNGIIKLAKETGVKVVPIAIYGIKNTFYEEDKLVWKDVYIKYGKSFSYKEYNDRTLFLDELKHRIETLYYEIEKEINPSETN